MEKQYKPRLETIYEMMHADFHDMPETYDDFAKIFTAPGEAGTKNRIRLHGLLRNAWDGVPESYDDFARTLFTTPREQMRSMKPTDKDVEDAWKATPRAVTPMEQVPGLDDWKPQGRSVASVRPPKDPYTDGVKVENPMVAAFGESSRKMVDDTRRMYEANTPAGRKKQQGLEIAGRMAGRNTRLPGLSVAMPTPEQPEASDGAQAAPKAQDMRGPQYYGTVVDQEDGQTKDRWLMPDGSVTTDFLKADVAAGDARTTRLQREAMTVSGRLRAALKEQARLEGLMRKRIEELGRQDAEHPVATALREAADASHGMPSGLVNSNGFNDYRNDEQYRQLESAARRNRQTIQVLSDKRGGRMDGFWHSMGTKLTDGYTFADGMAEMNDAIAQLTAARRIGEINWKRSAGQELTAAEEAAEAVLKNRVVGDEVQADFGGDYGAWARAGSMFAGSLDLMKDIMMTPGAASIAKGIASGVGKVLTKGVAKVTTDKVAEHMAVRAITKATGILIGAHGAGAVVSNTGGLGHTLGDTATGVAGDVAVGAGGYEIVGQKGLMSALAEAERSRTGENGSEMFGEFIPGLGGLMMKGLEKVGLKRIAGYLTDIGRKDWYTQYGGILKAGGYNGLPGEALEEYEGHLYDILTGHWSDAKEALGDLKTHIDIWLGCATAGALLGCVPMAIQTGHTAMYYKYKHAASKADAVASSTLGERWSEIRGRIDDAANQELTDVVADVVIGGGLTQEESAAVLGYVRNLVRMRGYNLAQMSADEEGVRRDDDAEAVEDAYSDGYNSAPEESAVAQAAYVQARERAEDIFGVEAAEWLEWLDESPARAVGEMRRMGQYSQQELDAVLDYVNAKATVNGMAQRADDDFDRQAAQCEAMVRRRVNREAGVIMPATMKIGDRQVYVVEGSVVMLPDGTAVDMEGSSKDIVVMDSQTGKYEFAAPQQILRMGEPIEAQDEIDTALAELELQRDMQLEALGMAASRDAHSAAGQGIGREAESERLVGEGGQRRSFAPNDEVELIDDQGGVTAGTITGEIGSDGLIVVRTDKPVNGQTENRLTFEELMERLSSHNGEIVDEAEVEAVATAGKPAAPGTKADEADVTDEADEADVEIESILSDEIDEYGNPFVKASNGSTDFGTIDAESGLDEAPIKLSFGENHKGNDGKNHGYGLVHIEAGHGDQIRRAGFESVVKFVESVARNYQIIREGNRYGDKPTYLLEVSDGHNNTLFIQLSNDGTYWNVNSAGIFREKYSRRKPEVKPVPTIGSSSSTETAEVNHGHTGGATVTSGNSSLTSDGKDINSASEKQEDTKESLPKTEVSALERLPKNEKGEPIFEEAESPEAGWDALVEFSEGDAATAKEIADTMVEGKRKAYEKVRKQVAKGKTPAELLASKKAIAAALARARGEYDMWQQIADVEQGRQAAIRAQAEDEEIVGRSLSDEEAQRLIAFMEECADVAPEIALTPENWAMQFGEDGILNTPIGEVKQGDNQYLKLAQQGRNGKLGMIKPTLEHPHIIIEDQRASDDSKSERETSYVFIRTFVKKDGSRYYHFASITVSKDGKEVVISSQERSANRISKLLQQGKVTWIDEKFSLHPTAQIEASVPLNDSNKPTTTDSQPALLGIHSSELDASSERKDNDSASEKQVGGAESSRGVEPPAGGEQNSEGAESSERGRGIAGDGRGIGTGKRGGESEAEALQTKLSREDATDIIAKMEMSAVNDPQISLSPESWRNSFGLGNSIDTPLGKVKMGEGQYQKLVDKKRSAEFGMVVQTLQDPDVVFIEPSEAKEGQTAERGFSYVFVKTFIRNGQKFKYYTSVSVLKDGMEVSVSSHIASKNAIMKKLQGMERAYTKQSLLPNSSEWHLAEHPTDVPDLLPTQGKSDANVETSAKTEPQQPNNAVSSDSSLSTDEQSGTSSVEPNGESTVSDSKDTNSASDKQESEEESSAQPADSKGEQTIQTAVEAASAQVNTTPTPAQAEAGNYKKGHVTIGEFDITIENPAGSVRKGVDADGKEWSNTMANAYGYIKGTEGVDGDHIDVFLHENMDQWNGRKVFVVDQTNTDGSFDEHKVMLGFNDKAEAMQAYLANYDKTWANTHPGLRISETNIEDFNKWVQSSHRKTKPFADYTTVRKEATVVIVERGAPEAAKLRQKSSRLEIEGAEKLSAERAEAVERYVEGHYCVPIRVIADEVDIRESGLSEVAVAQMMAALTEEDVPAVYCREDKKIYIFAGHKDSNVGSTLAHENAHALADAMPDGEEKRQMFETYRYALLADLDHGEDFSRIWKAVADAYPPHKRAEEFVAYTVGLMYVSEGAAKAIKRILDGNAKSSIFKQLVNPILYGTHTKTDAHRPTNPENRRGGGAGVQQGRAGNSQAEGRADGEESAGGEAANEPRRRHVARKQATTTGMSLFDWADAEERGRREVTTKDEKAIAAEEANAAIDGFVESYSRWLEHSAEIEAQLDAEGVEGELRDELTAQMESEETRIAEERDKLEEKLRDYYATDNTPEDATRIAHDMVSRVQAEVEIRHRKEHILSDLLNGSDETPIETVSDEAAAEEKSGEVKTGGGLISYDALGHLPDAKEGEFAYVERKFSRTGEFSFTGADKIRDRGDVAYLFRSLENYSVENVFAVLVKDGKARVLHIGMGTATSSLADMSAIRAGVDAFGADRIYLVHNHPSGTMVASQQDRNLMRTLEAAFGDKIDVAGIIIDTTSGRYVEFDGEGQAEVYNRPRQSDGDKMADVFHFDQADRSNMPEETMAIRSSSDVANAIGNLRFGDGKKVSYLILAHNGHVIGNFHTGYTDINASGLAEELASVASKYGGTSVVVYGNMPLDGVMRLKDAVARHSLGAVRLLDTLGVRNGIQMSAVDEGMLYEDGTPYGPAEVREPMVAARGREAFDALRDRAVAERGIVMPGLNEKVVRVVEVPRHDFAGNGKEALQAAEKWAKESIVGTHTALDSRGDEFGYTISGDAVEKYVSRSATGKSANIGVHLAALKKLPEIIKESIEAEVHPDYDKLNGIRNAENITNPETLIHRFYGAANVDGTIYRVKTTMREYRDKNRSPLAHSYEITQIELLEAPSDGVINNSGEPLAMTSNSSNVEPTVSPKDSGVPHRIANLLKGVEKSYDAGKKLLEESEKSELFRRGDERGSVADYSKIKKSVSASSQGSVGRDRFSEKRQAELATQERERMAARIRELAERLHLDNVEVVTDASHLEGVRATAKGFFNKRTGKITIVLPNNLSTIDAEQTLLHEAVAHYGLRRLFGEHFDAFLDNVYESATEEIRRKIAEMATRNGWNFRTATEEYLAGLAENTDFEAISRDAASQNWWAKVKQFFIDMVERVGFKGFRDKVGVTLTDNELRYILWRSYANLAEPGATRSIFGEAADIAKQAELKVGNYAEGGIEAEYVEPEDVADRIEKLFDAAVAGDLSGGPIEIGRLTPEGRDFLEKLSGKTLKENVSFVLNPSDLVHIYRRHFGANEADSRNTPLTRWDIRQIAEIITSPDKVLYGKEKDGNQRNMFFFLKEAEGGSYNLMEVYSDRRGNLTAKSFFKSKEGVSQRAVLLSESSTLTSVTDGATLLDGAKLPKFFDNPIVEEEELYRPGDAGSSEALEMRQMRIRMDLASRQRDNIAMRNAALRSLRKKIGKIRRAMEAQRVYDFNTVGDLREVAMLLMRNESFLPEGPGEVSRLLGILSRGIGHRYTDKDGVERVAQSNASYNAAVESLMDLFVSNQLRLSKGFLGEMLRVRGGKVNSRGVEVAGELDVQGQIMVKAMRHYIGSSAETIRTRMGDLDEIIAEGEGAASMNAAAEKLGLEFARQYADEVKFREEQEELMRGQLDDLAKRWNTKMPKAEQDAYRQEKRALEESIRKMRLERAEALRRIAAELGSGMRDSIERVKEFRDREKARVEEIRHNANSDMEGRPHYETDPNRGKMAKLRDSAVARVLMAPAATFEQMMRVFGRKSVDGEGYLFDRFVRGWQECRDREWTSTQAVEAELNKKAAELLGRKKARWSSLYDLTLVDAGTIKWKDGGKEVEHALSQGNLMYMYMVDKMADGRVKLRHMGITEEKMRQVESQLTPELKAAADWLQEEFLPKLRDKYNEVHMRMFGAPMADIDNYFPLRILANSRIENVEMDGNIDGMELPKTMTGAIIKRRHNSYALDIMGSDAVSVALDHVREMETWAAFAEYRRDLCTLLSYKRFRNQVRNMTTIYGSGDKLWKKFYNLALLAGGAYQPKVSEFDKAAVNLTKLATGACINFRINTAFKQILSLGAFAPECNAFRLLRNLSPWRMRKSWQWAMKYMPAFQRRWQSRQAGNETLSDWKYDWSWTQSGIVKAAQRVGMTPNAFVDALTVAIGSEAVFRSKYKEYRKDGFSKKWAYRRALQDAEVAFNLSQQSSEAPYLSLLQSDRTLLTTAVTTFRNSSMSYLRQSLQSKREMANMVRDREEQIVYEIKKGLRMGLTSEQAKARAKRKYRRNWARCLFKSATYDFMLPALWYLGNSGIYYLIFGDDDDKKKDIITDALIRGAAFGWAEGLTFGGTIPDFAYGLIMGREVQLNEESSPATGLLTDFANTLGKGKYEKAANMMTNMLGSLGVGVSVQTATDIFVAGIDLFGQDEKAAMDWTLFAMRVFQCPQSQMDMIYFDELGMTAGEAQGKSPAELAERYAAYKARRANFATMWAYDDERWDAVEEPWRKRFEDEAKARLREWNEGEVNEKLDAYEAEYKTTNKRRNALGDAPMGLPERAEAISGLNESPEGVRNEMYKKLNSTLKMMVETWLEAPTGQEAAADAIAIVEYKRWMAEQLDGWEGAKTDGAPGRDGKPRRIDSEQWRMAKRQAEALRKQWKEKRESRRYSGGTESTEGELKLEAQT